MIRTSDKTMTFAEKPATCTHKVNIDIISFSLAS